MKKLFRLILLAAFLFPGYHYYEYGRLPFLSSEKPSPFEAVFPRSLDVSFLFRLDDLSSDIRSQNLLFDVNRRGVPYLLHRNRLISLRSGKKPKALLVKGVDRVDQLAWAGDALLMVWGKRLGVLAKQGFGTLWQLPEKGLKIRAVNARQVYLYGGSSGSLYIYDRNRGLVHLLRAPSPIRAVSGNGTLTFLAIGEKIYLFSPGKPLSLVFRAASEVTSLAMAPPSGLFYSTAEHVGYVYDKG